MKYIKCEPKTLESFQLDSGQVSEKSLEKSTESRGVATVEDVCVEISIASDSRLAGRSDNKAHWLQVGNHIEQSDWLRHLSTNNI